MPYANLNGIRLYYEDTGSSHPAIIFSHGFLLDSDMFSAQVEALRPMFRCISWDQRGLGKSDVAREQFSYWDSAQDALGLLTYLGIEQAVFVGLSQGGFLSMRAALLAPTRVAGLVLISTRSGLDSEETIGNFNELSAEWSVNGCTNVSESLGMVLIGDSAVAAPWLSRWKSMGNDRLSWPIRALVDRDDITTRLGEIDCPALVIHGGRDQAIDVAHGQALALALPRNSGYVEIPDAGHAPCLTHPAVTNKAMLEFLALHCVGGDRKRPIDPG